MPQSCGVIVIPDLIGNPEKSMLDSRFRGNDSIEVRNLPTRLRGYKERRIIVVNQMNGY